MLYIKFSIIFIVYNCLVRLMLAISEHQIYNYDENTSNTIQFELLVEPIDMDFDQNQTIVFEEVPQSSLTIPTGVEHIQEPVLLVLEPALINNLPSDLENINVNLFNSAPLMESNPFINSMSQKLQLTPKTANKPEKLGSLSDGKEEGSFCRRSFDGRSGYCIVAYHCLHVIREYRLHGTKIDICTYRNNVAVICCNLSEKLVLEQRISAQKCKQHHEAVKDIKLDVPRPLSGKMCVASIPLIVGGTITQKEEYPHMAALGWTQSNKEIKWGCGGTIINDLYVLTAAHCATSETKAPNVVRVGNHILNKTSPHQQDIKIVTIILHPKYRSSVYYHDIALLKLAKRLHFTERIQPACLWQMSDLEMSNAVATGWGRTQFLGPQSNQLLKVELNIFNQTICKGAYYKERRLPHGISENQFCAGHLEGGKDTCQGDSGGPLHAELPEFNCVKFVIGITSFGKFCSARNAPGVYTKVYPYLDWIEKIAFRQ